MRWDWRIGAIWTCGLIRLLFYASMLPVWEGFDEWAHFAVIRAASHGTLLPPRDLRITRDVEASLGIVPLPWMERSLPPPSVVHDAFWQLPAEERQARAASFRSLAVSNEFGALPAYETQQPPLYYWMMAPLAWLVRGAPLADQVTILRYWTVLLASATIPLIFAIGEALFASRGLALATSAVVALMPGFAITVARVGNDGLAIALYAALVWLGIRAVNGGVRPIAMGLVLGLGLLTKAYFLTAIPAVALLFLYFHVRRWYVTAIGAFAAGGWWYARNLLTNGTLAGLTESAMPASGVGMWRHIVDIKWLKAIDSALFAHIYTGGWSMLTIRSWIYHLFYVAAAVAAIGLMRVRRDRRIWWLAAAYLAYWAGALYDILLLFVTRGVATSMGYYLYAVVSAEVPLAIAGFRRYAAAACAILFAALDLFTVHAVDIPYYAGLIRHTTGNALAAVHWSDFQAVGLGAIFDRLAMFKGGIGSAVLIALWTLYLGSTAAILVLALISIRKRETPTNPWVADRWSVNRKSPATPC